MKYPLALLFFCLTFSVKADIKNIPRGDLKNVKYLFASLIEDHDFSYTIFGSKPMSLADFGLEVPSNLPFHKRIKSHLYMLKRQASLNAWYKHRNKFELKDFIFLDDEKDLFNCLVLILINKKNMLDILRKHEAIFKVEIGESFEPESFLEKLENKDTTLAQATHKSQRLLGIMLGYGVRNATLFQERFDIMEAISKRKKGNLTEDNALTKKLNAIESEVGCFSELDQDTLISPLYFLADLSHPETIALQKQYEQERQQIIEIRKKPNFIEFVLNRLVTVE